MSYSILRSTVSTATRRGLAALLLALAACGGGGDSDTPTPVENVSVASVSVALSANQLLTGATTSATATVLSNKGTQMPGSSLSWQSSNTAIATVAGSGTSATVTAVAAGSVTISATTGGVTGTSTALTVSAPPAALTDLSVSPAAITLTNPGSTQAITTTPTTAAGATVAYANTTASASVATVTSSGGNPTITAVGKGPTTITITATASGAGLTTSSLTRTVLVTVLAVSSAQVTLPKNGLLPNGTMQAAVTLKSSNGTELANRQVTWTSSNPAIATVNATGLVTAIATGTTTISASSEGVNAPAQTLLVQPTSACVELQPDANTLALYHFNEGAGQTAGDAANKGRTATLGTDLTTSRDPAWITDGKFGGALHFTRTGDQATGQFVSLENAGVTLPTNQMTAEMYVRPKAPYGHSNLFVAGFINFTVNINSDGRIEFGIGNGTDWHIVYADAPNLNDGNWHHLAASYNGTTMRVIFDGQERLAVASKTVLANPNDFKIGGRWQNTYLNGDLDEIRVSNVARTLAEVLARYCP